MKYTGLEQLAMIDKQEDDEQVRLVFERQDKKGEWITYIIVGHYRTEAAALILQTILRLPDKL